MTKTLLEMEIRISTFKVIKTAGSEILWEMSRECRKMVINLKVV